ncbi:MAG TPA: 2-amino-4-hydroxy-6-hydroxymethyldihydropteridine diphosphokinase [Rhizomicrobium sp.]|jgi:2-amino-4-hydroxy-6-hydroxymethyldihydropteridine diphosphokinase|nr:2-amino-4-hydroxy-6-hydroxymethyldihydropteridine diphosphokinase [Rhizomicrobium sp.]
MILIGLGASIPSRAGAPDSTLRAALAELAVSGVNIVKLSRIYRTPAWPDPRDPEFANAVAHIETQLTPQQLMQLLHATETSFGRTRSVRNAPRTLDLDLIDYDGRVEQGDPILPHPRIAARNFVLIPMRDVAPDWKHPLTGATIVSLIAALPDAERELPLW